MRPCTRSCRRWPRKSAAFAIARRSGRPCTPTPAGWIAATRSCSRPAFHDDAYDDHGNFKGDKATALAYLKRSAGIKETTASFHHIGNILIDLKGDEADVETYFMASQRREDGGKSYTRMRAGRYLDHFVRRDGTWRVLKRRVIDDWSRLDEVVATALEVGSDNNLGTRDRNDLSYTVEGFLQSRKGPAS